MKKIGIIGVGKIGSHIADNLISSALISEIHVTNRNADKLEGTLLSLELSRHVHQSHVAIKELDWNKVNDLDILVICIKDRYDPRLILQNNNLPDWLPPNLRYVGLRRDLPLLKSIAERIANYDKKIGVITNPIEITSYFLSKWVPSATIVGMGASVDSSRAAFFIEKGLGRKVDISCCLVAGEHGNRLFAVSKFWHSDESLKKLKRHEVSDYLKKATKVGFDIVKKQGYTLLDCAPIFSDDVEWLLGRGQDGFRSFAVSYNECFISRPLSLSDTHNLLMCECFTHDEEQQLGQIEETLTNLLRTFEKRFAGSL